MAILKISRYTRSERRAIGLLTGIILLINLGTVALRSFAEPQHILMQDGFANNISDSVDIPSKQSVNLELNSADSIDLLALYGIGAVFSRRILKYRSLLGGYYSPEQLLEVYGMDSARYLGFHEEISADPNLIRKINLTTVEFRDLLRHPYIQYDMVKSFVSYRDRSGPPTSLSLLWTEASWPDSLKSCLLPYLSLGE
ncbi:MAG: helix-hairpin-helix domain-containing protein [Bacteroidales bacterium]|nr:helix-hairpin-helix domain-containing protein [Bacteroidales bacterium]